MAKLPHNQLTKGEGAIYDFYHPCRKSSPYQWLICVRDSHPPTLGLVMLYLRPTLAPLFAIVMLYSFKLRLSHSCLPATVCVRVYCNSVEMVGDTYSLNTTL